MRAEDVRNPSEVAAEELLNSVTHGFGLLLSVPGAVLLLWMAAAHGEPMHLAACGVFGAALVLMYAASFLYHSASDPRKRFALRVLDHVAIYLLIAGTYTPFLLLAVGDARGATMLLVVWGLALAGTVFKVFCTGRYVRVSTATYLLMGWLSVLILEDLLAALPPGGLAWLVAGGAAYTGGVVFFAWNRLPYNHAIWHVCVLAGSLCHYMAVLSLF